MFEIIKLIKRPRNAIYLRMLSTKLSALLGFATDATECAKKALEAFSDWEVLIGTLRRTIFDKQGAVPPPPPSPPVRPPLAIPRIPILPAPDVSINLVRSASRDDPLWAELPELEASIRRLYGFVTYNADGIGFPGILATINGGAYITRLQYRLLEHQTRLATSRTTDIAYTCGIMRSLTDILAVTTPLSLSWMVGLTISRSQQGWWPQLPLPSQQPQFGYLGCFQHGVRWPALSGRLINWACFAVI